MKSAGKSVPWQWTEAQRTLFEFPCDTLVSASAGTGKTTALVELCVRLVEGRGGMEPVPLERILAITFTNRAAAEMAERLMRKLGERMEGPMWKWVGESWFHTFHSLGVRILSEHAFDLGLPPDFEALPEEEAALLAQEAIEEVLREALAGNDPTVLRLAAATHWKELVKWLKDLMILSGEESLEEDFDDDETDLKREFERLKREQQTRLDELDAFRHREKISTLQADKLADFFAALPKPETFDFDDDAEAGLARFDQASNTYAKSTRWPRPIGSLRGELMELLELQRAVFAERLARPDLSGMKKLATEAYRRYADAKRRRGGIDFDDMISMSLNVLRNNPSVLASWRSRFDVILVDEFQDTNQRQLDFVELLSHPGNSERLPTRRLFVGDRKQSIYAFRGADVAVMRRSERTFSNHEEGRIVHLGDNFRSSPELIGLFNGIFPDVLAGGGEDWEVHYTREDDLKAGTNEESAAETGTPAELNLIEFEGSASEGREIEARHIARRIAEIMTDQTVKIPDGAGGFRPPTYGDFAILIRRNKHAADFEKALREQGIPLAFSGSYGFSSRPEILDALQLLTLVADPGDPLAALGVARSPALLLNDPDLACLHLGHPEWSLFLERPGELIEYARRQNVSDEGLRRLESFSNVFKSLREMRHLRSVPELLESLLERSDLFALSTSGPEGARAKANLRQLLERAWDFHKRHPGLSLDEFLSLWKRKLQLQGRDAEASPDLLADAVKLMTVHQAKGLEFPIVMLPGLAQYPPFKGGRVYRTGASQAGIQYYAGAGRFEKTYSYIKGLKLQALQDQAEQMRLFYVALTRAKEYLAFSSVRTGKQIEKGPVPGPDIRHWLDAVWNYARTGHEIAEHHVEATENTPPSEEKTEPPRWVAEDPAPPFMPLGMGTISISRLAMHDRCPRRFHLQRRIDRSAGLWHGVSRENDPPLPEAGARQRGLLLHAALERLPLDRPVSREEIANLLRSLVETDDETLAGPQEILEALFRSEWIQSVRERLENGAEAFRELAVLTRFDFPSGRFVRLKGVLDLLLVDPGGGREVIEFKTGNPRKIHEFQCKTYACAIRQSDPGRTVKARLVYLGDDPEMREFDIGGGTCRTIVGAWEKRLDAIEEEAQAGWEHWRHPPEAICHADACPFLDVCYPQKERFDPMAGLF